MKVKITLNGTDVNPNLKLGFTQNPFPAIPKAEFATANRMIAKLDAEPLKSTDDIRRILAGCTEEFIELCCSKFVLGERVSFYITFPD